jgi:hypothetical protein
MVEDWQWAIGAAISLGLLVLGLGNRDRALQRQISDGRKENVEAIAEAKRDMGQKIEREIESLHSRVGRVQENYVRRDDFQTVITGWEKRIDEVKRDLREDLRRIE